MFILLDDCVIVFFFFCWSNDAQYIHIQTHYEKMKELYEMWKLWSAVLFLVMCRYTAAIVHTGEIWWKKNHFIIKKIKKSSFAVPAKSLHYHTTKLYRGFIQCHSNEGIQHSTKKNGGDNNLHDGYYQSTMLNTWELLLVGARFRLDCYHMLDDFFLYLSKKRKSLTLSILSFF